eukprot:g50644.t1
MAAPPPRRVPPNPKPVPNRPIPSLPGAAPSLPTAAPGGRGAPPKPARKKAGTDSASDSSPDGKSQKPLPPKPGEGKSPHTPLPKPPHPPPSPPSAKNASALNGKKSTPPLPSPPTNSNSSPAPPPALKTGGPAGHVAPAAPKTLKPQPPTPNRKRTHTAGSMGLEVGAGMQRGPIVPLGKEIDFNRTPLKVPPLNRLSPEDIALALMKSERGFLTKILQELVFTYERRLNKAIEAKRPILSPEEVTSVFLNISNIFEFNLKFYKDLCEMDEKGPGCLVQGIGSHMAKIAPFFRLYQNFIENAFGNGAQKLKELRQSNEKFNFFVELNQDVMGGVRLFDDLLQAPATRFAQYLQYMAALYLASQGKSYLADLEKAVQTLQKTTDDITVKLTEFRQRNNLMHLQQNVFGGNCNLLSPTRYVVKMSTLKLWQTGQAWVTVFFALCNDMLMYGTKGTRLMSGSVTCAMQLSGIVVQDVPEDIIPHSFRIKSRWKKPFVMRAKNAVEKKNWIQLIWTQVKVTEKRLATLKDGGQDEKRLAGPNGGQDSQSQQNAEDFEAYVMKKTIKPKPAGKVVPVGRPSTAAAAGGTAGLARQNSSKKPQKWRKVFDDNYQTYYYEQVETLESRWERPEDYESDDDGASLPAELTLPGSGSATPQGVETPRDGQANAGKSKFSLGVWDKLKKRSSTVRDTQEAASALDGSSTIASTKKTAPPEPPEAPKPKSARLHNPWTKVYDENYGVHYYEHETEGVESVWERPPEYYSDEEDATEQPPVVAFPPVDSAPAAPAPPTAPALTTPPLLTITPAAPAPPPVVLPKMMDSATAGSSAPGLLDQIQKGKSLKAVQKPPPGQAPAEAEDDTSLAAALQKSLNAFRSAVAQDDDMDQAEEEDWE